MGKKKFKPKPNEICPFCDSNKKYKKCCGSAAKLAMDAAAVAQHSQTADTPAIASALVAARSQSDAEPTTHGPPGMISVKDLGRNPANLELACDMLQKGMVDDHARQELLMETSVSGNAGLTTMLVEAKANLNMRDKYCDDASPLYMSSQQGFVEVVKVLLDAKADLHQRTTAGGSPVHAASDEGREEVLRMLIDAKADVNSANEGRFSPLWLACGKAHTGVIKILLRAKANVNQVALGDSSPLWAASHSGNVEALKLLLDAKADVHKVDEIGASPLWAASQCGHTEAVKLLIHAQADPNQADTKDGACPLHVTSKSGHMGVAKELIRAKANINKSFSPGQVAVTALDVAAMTGHASLVRLLIKHGAVETSKLPGTQTPARLEQWAGVQQNPEVKALLLRRRCGGCGGLFERGQTKPCGGCKQVSYCSRECQKKDWKKHKSMCKKMAAREAQQQGQGHEKPQEDAGFKEDHLTTLLPSISLTPHHGQ